MMIEIGFIRKLGLTLGHPTYAISIVLAALIFSTGIGSLLSQRMFQSRILDEKRTAVLIALYTIVSLSAHDYFATSLVAQPIEIKALIVIVFLFPLGFLMGQLFPQGLRRAADSDSRLVPWVWAINGTVSTVFVGIGHLASQPFGFNVLPYAGAAIYLIILLLPLKMIEGQTVSNA